MKPEPDIQAPATLSKIFAASGSIYRTRNGTITIERSGLLGQFKCSGRAAANEVPKSGASHRHPRGIGG